MGKFMVWGMWILGAILFIGLILYSDYWIHERISVAQYSKAQLARFFRVPTSEVVISEITLAGGHPWAQVWQPHEWTVNYLITGKPVSQTGNIFELSERASGHFFNGSIPTS